MEIKDYFLGGAVNLRKTAPARSRLHAMAYAFSVIIV